MVEFEINVNRDQRLVYIPKKVLDSLGHSLTIVPDSNAAILYPTGKDPETVVKSVEVLLQDLRLRISSKGKVRK
jgi:hypothetical protein